jgi:ketosteroid isomerase-like protein
MTIIAQRLQEAINSHDIEVFVSLFDPNYQSEQPVYPDRAFGGSDQVRTNWTNIFSGVPDIHADLLRYGESGDTVWSEWYWSGTRVNGDKFEMAGVILMGVRENRIVWGRLYMNPVVHDSGDINASMRQWTQGSSQE